jgi:hypothetical protein
MFAAIEMKSGETFSMDFFKGLDFWRANLPARAFASWVVYGGANPFEMSRGAVLPWNGLAPLLAALLAYSVG